MEYQIIKPKNKDSDQSSTQVEEPKWTLEEVALPSSTLNDVDEMLAYISNKGKLLHDWEFERFLKTGKGLSINFFGLPGTGKSITADAVAQRLGTTIVRANYGELESELMGGTAKNLLSVFDVATKSNSVLFFDEADSLLSRRVSNLSQAADYGINATKSTMLTLMDKFDGVLILID
jgi:ATP-dependent 26S proteasome regulatory subunit